MKVENNKLTTKKAQTTSEVSFEMKITEKNIPLMFKLIVERLYRNKLGSMIREITSNSHDAHVEAGVKSPVIVKLTKGETNYLSFIDNGVGMSSSRVEDIYCSLGESTKNDSDDEIGGYGIGGKTPLAYTESFFIITRFDGTIYTYTVRMDEYVPKVDLMFSEPTDECNGTEVRVAIPDSDISTVVHEIKKQLYYFENIIFQGFDDSVSNDYHIYRGKTFIYRGEDYSGEMHVSLGKVAYPIDYSALELNSNDYRIPVAIKLNIGEAKVIPSREDLEYDKDTKKLIIRKLDEVKAELKEMLSRQYEKITSLEDYYNSTENFGKLLFPNDTELNLNGFISKSEIDYTQFKYNAFKLPTRDRMLENLYSVKRYGKAVPKRSWSDNFESYSESWRSYTEIDNKFHVKNKIERKIVKQAYLTDEHGRFFVFTPRELEDDLTDSLLLLVGAKRQKAGIGWNEPMEYDVLVPNTTAIPLLKSLRKEFIKMVEKTSDDYNEIVVPQEFIDDRKLNKSKGMSKDILKVGIPMKTPNYGGQSKRVTMERLKRFNGRIYYGFRDDDYQLRNAHSLAYQMLNREHVAEVNKWNGFPKKGLVFVQISQVNEKYMKMLGKKVLHVDHFYKTLVNRKIDMIVTDKINGMINNVFYHEVDDIFKIGGFENVDKGIADDVKIISDSLNKNGGGSINGYLNREEFTSLSGIELDDLTINDFKHKEKLDSLVKISVASKEYLKWINTPYRIDKDDKEQEQLITLLGLAINK